MQLRESYGDMRNDMKNIDNWINENVKPTAPIANIISELAQTKKQLSTQIDIYGVVSL